MSPIGDKLLITTEASIKRYASLLPNDHLPARKKTESIDFHKKKF
jgi:hypothetical protein